MVDEQQVPQVPQVQVQQVRRGPCRCAQCRVRGLMGPIVLITIGVLFLIGEYSRYQFWDLWPILLIVIGVVLVGQSLVSREGHIGS